MAGAAAFLLGVQLVWPAPTGVVVQGVVVGSLTALVAFGLSLVYGANRVVNFAQAELGVVPAVVMVTLVTARGWPWLAALALALGLAAVLGATVERVVVRPFSRAPRLILMVATIGLAQVLAGAGTALPFLLGGTQFGEQLPSPFDLEVTIDPIVFHGNDLLVVVVVPLAIAGLWWFLRRTGWGVAIRASAESADRASLLGIDVLRTQSVVWTATALLATVAMILRAGVLGLPVGSAFGPSILLRALAAAVVGRMFRYERMFLAAIAFGVVETAILWNEDSSTLLDAAMLVLVVGFLLLQRPDRESRAADQAISSWRSAAVVRAVPRQLARLPEVRLAKAAAGVVVLGGLALLPAALDDGQVNLAGALFVFCMIAVSLVVLTGWAGEISLGQMAFVAIGSATAAIVNVHLGWDLSVTVLLAGVVGAAAAALVGIPALRIRGLFLAVTTLAFALMTSSILLNRDYVGALPDNTTERVVRLPLFGRTDVSSERAFYFVCLAALCLVLWLAANLQRTRLRRVVVAARENERATQSFGIDLTRTRLTAFALSGFVAAFAGGVFTFHQQALGEQVFAPVESLRVLTMAVVGGLGSIPGALLGATFLKSTEWFDGLVAQRYQALFRFAGTGVGLLLVLRFLPGGLAAPLYAARDAFLRWVARRRGLPVPSLAGGGRAARAARPLGERLVGLVPRRRRRRAADAIDPAAPALRVRGIDVHYGPVQILFGVDLEVARGSIVALLGTNGAGKSTLLRAVSGLTPPTAGRIEVDGVDVTGLAPHETVRLGIVQVPGGKGVFPSLTVDEHLTLAAWPLRHDRVATQAAIDRALATFPVLADRRDSVAATLSGGQQQMLTLAMAFIPSPKLLMIDELSLGLAPVVVEQLLDVVRALNAAGTTVVVVEQSVNVALTVAGTASFLEKGEIRFSGPTGDLLDRPDVLRAVYLRDGGRRDPSTPRDRRAREPQVPALVLERVSKRFGGARVIDDVSLRVADGEIVGLIGPNGAGKTTLFDLVGGFLRPDSGTISIRGVPVDRLRPDQRQRAGLARSFQDPRLFGELTVLDTLRLALDHRLEVRDPVAAAIGLPGAFAAEAAVTRDALELVEAFGLGEHRDRSIVELSTGSRRIVDIACQYALGCPVILFDEPSSGIAQREAEALVPLLRRVRDELAATLLVIDHDMPLLTAVADRLVALHLGQVVCDGDAATVLSHPEVVASYLGSGSDAIARSGARNGRRATTRRARPAAARSR